MTNLFQLENVAYVTYQDYYNNCKDFLNRIGYKDCLKDKNYYTFASDMVVYLMDRKTSCTEISKYINRMLKTHCRKNKQGYYAMMIAVSAMKDLFYKYEYNDEFRCLDDWYIKLWYDDGSFYRDYITKEEYDRFVVVN